MQNQTALAKDIQVTKEQKLGSVLLAFLLVALYIPTVLPDGLLKNHITGSEFNRGCNIIDYYFMCGAV